MTKQVINIGTLPNDKTGDKLRDAMNKVNLNFTELYSGSTLSQLNDVDLTGLTANQYLGYNGTNWHNTTAGLSGTSSFWVSSSSGGTADTQLIFINGILISRI